MVLVDDDEAVHRSLRTGLSAVVAAGSLECFLDPAEAVENICLQPPHVVLMDIHMPGLNGIECVHRIKRVHPRLPVVMFTAFFDPQRLVGSLLAGACGYLVKPSSPDEMSDAVATALRGIPYFCAEAEAALAKCFYGLAVRTAAQGQLSPRERQALSYLLQGCSDKEIAFELRLRDVTARSHVHNIIKRLKLQHRSDLFRPAFLHK